ncbi:MULTISPECIES: serine protease, partial [unclassified Frankia]|uniref:S1 family peptidase n=1 Tax=unclassified Frankia TaxID=2632575 RepID=UPI002AD4F564
MGLDAARIVEVYAAGKVGSGYAVTDRLVLTAEHVVAAGAGSCEVRPLGSAQWLSAAVVWSDESCDGALLKVAGRPWAAVTSGVGWGRLDERRVDAEPVSAVTVGFPWAKARPDGVRGSESALGSVTWEFKSGRLDFSVQSPSPRLRQPSPNGEPMSAWAGMSGGPVFAGGLLVGVVTDDAVRFNGRLIVSPVAGLLAAGLGTRLGELTGGQPPPLEDLAGPVRIAAGAGRVVELTVPYEPLPDWSAPDATPARLLRPEHGVVPFAGRDDMVDELVDWCVTPGAGIPARRDRFRLTVVTGGGGTGKTRLAAEVCARLTGTGLDWDAGFVRETAGAAGSAVDRATLLVVDDADLAGPLLPDLIDALTRSRVRVRLLLLARHLDRDAGWWNTLDRDTKGAAGGLLDGVVALSDRPLDAQARDQHAAAAAAAFAPFGPDTAPAAVPRLSAEAFDNALLVHMTMLLATVDRDPLPDTTTGDVRGKILHGVLNLERARWSKGLHHRELGSFAVEADDSPADAAAVHAVVMTTLTAPVSQPDTVTVLGAVAGLDGETARTLTAIYRWLRSVYPAPGGGVGPLRPDLLAEQLLTETAGLADLATAAVSILLATRTDGAGRLTDQAHRSLAGLLDELTRAAGRPPVRTATEGLLDATLPDLVTTTVAHRNDDPVSALPSALAGTLTAAPRPASAPAALAGLPHPSRALAELAVVLAGQTVTHHRQTADTRTPATDALAGSLNNLAIRLSAVGRRAEALAPATE